MDQIWPAPPSLGCPLSDLSPQNRTDRNPPHLGLRPHRREYCHRQLPQESRQRRPCRAPIDRRTAGKKVTRGTLRTQSFGLFPLQYRFALSFGDVEELFSERGTYWAAPKITC